VHSETIYRVYLLADEGVSKLEMHRF